MNCLCMDLLRADEHNKPRETASQCLILGKVGRTVKVMLSFYGRTPVRCERPEEESPEISADWLKSWETLRFAQRDTGNFFRF